MRKVYDAIIIGTGAAGYSAADWLFKAGVTDIAVISENRLSGTSRNTGSDKQTYYKISMDSKSEDSPYRMAEDICSLGCCDGEKAFKQAINSAKCFLRLCDYGMNFPRNEYGGYPGYKTDHDNTSRATSVGPLTSKMMTRVLEKRVLEVNKTPLLDNRQVIEIITDKKRVHGVIVLNKETNQAETIAAKNVIAATGAPACIYENSVFPESQHGMTGILIKAGVKLCNFTQWQYGMASTDFRWNVSGSFMQVIPRVVSIDKNGNESEFLNKYFKNINEALDNVFLKGYQWPFSFDRILYSSRVDAAVHEEIKAEKSVYLDFTRNPEGYDFGSLSDEAKAYLSANGVTGKTPIERLKSLNPKAIDVYARQGIDLYTRKLKIAVCAQHNNGGIHTDGNYETCIKGLYVIGEAAGSFGLTRPGGSALNDTQVGGLVCAEHIKNSDSEDVSDEIIEEYEKNINSLIEKFSTDINTDYSFIPKKMSEVASFIREKEGCAALLSEINGIISGFPLSHNSLSKYFYDLDMLISAKALLETILGEMPFTGSRGGAVFVSNGEIVKENKDYRKFLTISDSGKTYFEEAKPIPHSDKPFEYYLNQISEKEF